MRFHTTPCTPTPSSLSSALFMHDNKTNHALRQGREERKKANDDKSFPYKLGLKRLIRCWHTKHRLCLPVRWSLSTEL